MASLVLDILVSSIDIDCEREGELETGGTRGARFDIDALLWRLGDLCEKNAHIIATIDAWDNGKPYQQALDEDVGETISVFRYYAGWADKIYGQTIETSKLKLAYTKHEPLGKSRRKLQQVPHHLIMLPHLPAKIRMQQGQAQEPQAREPAN